jgi:hypothetical protein
MLPKTFVLALCLALPALAVKQRVELVTTDRADLPAGGMIHIQGATGELNITGWDQPSVEVMTTRYEFTEERNKEKTAGRLKRIEVAKMVSSNGDLTITTTRKGANGLHLVYQIMVPRTSRLVVDHRIGDVIVTNFGGEIDATSKVGDIVVQLLEPERYQIDAKSRFGTVYSDFDSPRHHGVIGERLIQDAADGDAKAAAHKITLRVRLGGISIQKIDTAAPYASAPAGL